MKRSIFALLKGVGLAVLGIALLYVAWQPVIPSRWIVARMAEAIPAPNLGESEEKVIRFDLSGKGGGVFNLVLRKDTVRVIEGRNTERLDLVLFMEAKEFNDLMISLARGKADALTFKRLVISKLMRFGGDMEVLQLLSPDGRGGK